MAITDFIPQIWSARLLAHLDKLHVYANLVNRDYEGEIRAYGDTVHINQIGDITIFDYDGSDLPDPEELDGEQQSLVIDQANAFNFQVKDIDNAQTNPKLMDDAMQRASYGMNDAIDTFLADLLAAGVDTSNILADDTSPLTPTSTTAYDYLVELGVLLSEANVPTIGRWVVVPPWYHGLLLKDDRFVGNGTDFNRGVLENGIVGQAAGFTIHVSNNVPNTDGTLYKVLAGTNAAGSFAEQLVEMEAYRLEKNFSDGVKGLQVYGAKVIQPKAIAVMSCNKS
ncbi:MAG: P22 coat protein - protein 5 domain protein [Clostridiales bacterium]|nr:P22 coat protein - protein 5 domain protein [Clostridiales bacterium]